MMQADTPVFKTAGRRRGGLKLVPVGRIIRALLYMSDLGLERLAQQLERPDSALEVWLGYGLCGVTILYLLGSIIAM